MNEIKQLELTGTVMMVRPATVRVLIERSRRHPLYRKRYPVHRRLLAHLPAGLKVAVGDTVSLLPTRPLSKRKSWRVVKATA